MPTRTLRNRLKKIEISGMEHNPNMIVINNFADFWLMMHSCNDGELTGDEEIEYTRSFYETTPEDILKDLIKRNIIPPLNEIEDEFSFPESGIDKSNGEEQDKYDSDVNDSEDNEDADDTEDTEDADDTEDTEEFNESNLVPKEAEVNTSAENENSGVNTQIEQETYEADSVSDAEPEFGSCRKSLKGIEPCGSFD